MFRFFGVLAVLMVVVTPLHAQQKFDSNVHHLWTGLNVDPLRNPNDPKQIRRVMRGFLILPPDVADELADKVIANREGRPGTLCIGETLPGMSFGNAVVWNGTVEIAWKNAPRKCTPTTEYAAMRLLQDGRTVYYSALRVQACKNIAPGWPRFELAPPVPPGPDYSGIPPVVCPPLGGIPRTCC